MSKNVFYRHPLTRLDINERITVLLLQSGSFPRMSGDWKASRGMRRAELGVRGEVWVVRSEGYAVMQSCSYAVAP
jgi:hypothetical protein